VPFSALCKGRGLLFTACSKSAFRKAAQLWLESFQLLLGICHLLGRERMFITVSRVTSAEVKKQLGYTMERAGPKDEKFKQHVLNAPVVQTRFLSWALHRQ